MRIPALMFLTSVALVGLASVHPAIAAPAAAPATPAPLGVGQSRPAASRPPTDRLRPAAPRLKPPSHPIMRLADVRPGMTGEALTVFRGTKPETFKVRVVSIIRNFLPKQDVILVRAEDPRVEFTGIAAGMSGSPVFIEGKLAGAVAYAWSFSKEPLAGVTPIETMLAERQRPRRGASDMFFAQADTRPASLDEPRLQQVALPLSVSGISNAALGDLTEQLKPFGMVPVRAGGGGGSGRLPGVTADKLALGAPVGVQLVRGDMSAVAMGTLTYVQDDTVIAFGHPMFGVGEVNLPMVLGEVHTFIPSLATSFKMASPVAEIGAVVQDRPSCIIGDLTKRATMVPVEVLVTAPDSEGRTFRAEVARNRRLTPILTSMVVTSAVADAEPDIADMAVAVISRLDIRGYGSLELRDHLFSNEGVSPRLLSSSRGLRALTDLMANPFEPAIIDRVDVDVRIEFRRDVAEIVGVALPGDLVRAGDTMPLRVTLRPYAGPEYTETVPVKIPRRLAGESVRVEVASGTLVKPDTPKPESLRGFIDNLRSFYTNTDIVVSLSTPDDGASLRGRLIPTLPQSALDTLRPGNQTRRADSYRVAERTVVSSARPVVGKQELTISVRDDVLGKNQP